MAFNYNHNYFDASMPSIDSNEKLRLPQIEAYTKLKDYFKSDFTNRNALVVLPTGVGKTGLIAIAPYQIAKGRVLIITPWTTVRDTIIEALNPDSYNNFWLKRDIFKFKSQLPNLIEYSSDTSIEVLNAANIVVLNAQKLQSRLDSSLINRVSDDFFDMIIIDEAHHSTAKTWVECVDYFQNAKVLKVTGTPFRTDQKQINGELVYKYPLSRAMYNNYVKSLQNIVFIPEELRLTIDNDESKTYTINQIYDMNLKDSDWVTRSIAYSLECSEKIVNESAKLLDKKLRSSNVPHKIIAIACSITHAKQIAKLYEEKGYKVALIHSDLSDSEKESKFKDINNHRINVVVNVAMLGEGYDHPYLSIAAIFRPFRNELPYAQFIGRILRYIDNENLEPEDNIGQIVSHKHLELDNLWEKYKIEIQESEIIKRLRNHDELLDKEIDYIDQNEINNRTNDVGKASHYGAEHLQVEDYMNTRLIELSKEKDEETKEKIENLKKIFNLNDDQAKLMIEQMESSDSSLKRPDIVFSNKKKNIDSRIREEIVPRLIMEYNVEEDSDDLKNLSIFEGKYWYITNKHKQNNAMLAVYMNAYLRNEIGKGRSLWSDDDFDRAQIILDELEQYIENSIKELVNI